MKRSTDRFLTTHTGSLPRPDDLIQMMFAKESGVPVDSQALQARIRKAVAEVVALQTKAGVDLVNDGEMSKPSYATYIKDRLGGFGGTGNSFVYQDLADFPVLERKVAPVTACDRLMPTLRAAVESDYLPMPHYQVFEAMW
jgi:5-methyltetrahydropteroyltriglutamate--homocysteine methyltransferase